MSTTRAAGLRSSSSLSERAAVAAAASADRRQTVVRVTPDMVDLRGSLRMAAPSSRSASDGAAMRGGGDAMRRRRRWGGDAAGGGKLPINSTCVGETHTNTGTCTQWIQCVWTITDLLDNTCNKRAAAHGCYYM
eukprot:COSAG01_NODE_26646_length_707_cov_1.175987_1_plen_134_part_10